MYSPLQNDKNLDLSKLEALADNTLKVVKIMKLLLDRVESIVGKEENASYQHFLLFPQCFQKLSKVRIEWKRVNQTTKF